MAIKFALYDENNPFVTQDGLDEALQDVGGDSLPRIVAESLNEQDDDNLAIRISFDGDTTSVVALSANLGLTFTTTYVSGITSYAGTVAKSAMIGGTRLVVMFTMGSGEDIRLVWQKNYSIVDFGIVPEQTFTQLPQLVTEVLSLNSDTNTCRVNLMFTSDTATCAFLCDNTPVTGVYIESTDVTLYNPQFPLTRLDSASPCTVSLTTSDGREVFLKTYITSDFTKEETDPLWQADKPNYETTAATIQKITNHNIDSAAHGYIVDKVATIQSVIPGTVSSTNKLVSTSDLQSGLNSVYVPGAMIYKGVLANADAIQALSAPAAGDYYQALDTGVFWIYNGTEWQETSGLTEFDGYTKAETDTLIAAESDALESEIKKILDDYAAEHGGDTNDWALLWGGMGETVALPYGLDVLQATEVMIVVRQSGTATGAPFATGMTVFPITDRFTPGPNPVFGPAAGAYNAGGVSYSNNGDAGIVMFQFTDYKTVNKIYGPSGSTLCGVLYRSVKPNAVIQYYKDPTIVAANEPDYTQRVTIDTTSFYPATVAATGTTFGQPFVAPEPCFICMRPQLTFETDQTNAPMITINIDGESVIANSLAIRYYLTGNKVFKWNCENLFVDKGQAVTFGVAVNTDTTVSFPVKFAWYYKTKGAILDATEEAFNTHTQNLDIHLSPEEKLSVDSISSIWDAITTVQNTQTKHVLNDAAHWGDYHKTEFRFYDLAAASQGLMRSPNTSNFPIGTAQIIPDGAIGVIQLVFQDTDTAFTTVTVNGNQEFVSEGFATGITFNKTGPVKAGDTVIITGPSVAATFYPWVPDPDSMLAKMAAQFAKDTTSAYVAAIDAAKKIYSGMGDTDFSYDFSQPKVIIGNGGVIAVGGSNETYTVEQNGAIIVTYTAILAAAKQVLVDDAVVWQTVLSLLGANTAQSPSEPIRVSTGQTISSSGLAGVGESLTVTFYPNLGA